MSAPAAMSHGAQPHELDEYRRGCWARTWQRLLADAPAERQASDAPADIDTAAQRRSLEAGVRPTQKETRTPKLLRPKGTGPRKDIVRDDCSTTPDIRL